MRLSDRPWRRRFGALCAALLLALCVSARAARVMVVSDPHYMAPELYEGSDLFLRALRAGDGKLTQRGEEWMAALRAQVLRQQPDALIVTGDLSFNGERRSHEALARWLGHIEADGTPVWVIPGNHDINVATPRAFVGDGWTPAEGVTPEAFSAIYADFMGMPGEGANLSYAVPIDDGLWVAMTDVAFYRDLAQTFGVFTAGHADWLEGVLEEAGEAEVVTATHHSLLPHTEFSRDSFLMLGSQSMADLARRHGVRLNLSGHIHAQHVLEQDGLTDAALGAFCIWPHRYALVTLGEDGALEYEARSLDEDLLPEGFMDTSREWFAQIAADKARALLTEADDADAAAMADYAARFNLAYFSGAYDSGDPSWRQDAAFALWRDRADNLFWQYMNMVMNEENHDNLHRRIGKMK